LRSNTAGARARIKRIFLVPLGMAEKTKDGGEHGVPYPTEKDEDRGVNRGLRSANVTRCDSREKI
jgi:hypothetical protein